MTTMVGFGALLALSPDAPAAVQELLFGDVLALTGRTLRWPRAWRGACWLC